MLVKQGILFPSLCFRVASPKCFTYSGVPKRICRLSDLSHSSRFHKRWLGYCVGPDKDLLGDFGARDPFPEELESNFGDKVLGNATTEHLIKPPDEMEKVIGLKSKKCLPCESGVPPLSEPDIERLCNQVPGWQLIKDEQGKLRIRSEWKVRNFKCGLSLFERICEIAESEKHHPDLHLVSYNKVSAELYTHSIGGLSENDFIMAAKINELDIADLLSKKKTQFWA